MFLPENLNINLEPILREAGNILLSYFRTDLQIYNKGTSFATQADIECENFLKQRLSELLPQASFNAEESGQSGTGQLCWVIDPLDGTTNFAQGLPYFCVSVALTYLNDPILGVTFDPIRDEYFYTQKNLGAFLNGKKIEVSKKNNLSESVWAISFPYGIPETYDKNWALISEIGRKTFTMRIMGAAALDLAYVACGRFDGAFFYRLEWWDVAVGTLLINEAGGATSDFEMNPIMPEFKSFMGGNRSLHRSLFELF